MRVRCLARPGLLLMCGVTFSCLACGGSTSDGATSSGGSTGEGGAGLTTGGGSATTGGSLIQASGGASASASGGLSSTSADDCQCPAGGDPYSVLVRGDGEDAILWSNRETAATAELACDDWLNGPLRGSLASSCGGQRLTFAACVGPDAGPPCLLVDHNSVTYIDAVGQTWTGSTSDVKPSTSPTVRDPLRQEGSFSVDVTRDGATRSLSVFYVLCGPGQPASRIPC